MASPASANPGPGFDAAATLTPANLASLQSYPVARIAALGIARQTGQGQGVLSGMLQPLNPAQLAGQHPCRAVYFTPGHVNIGETKSCAFSKDADGPALTVPGLFFGHIAAAEAQRLIFYGVRLAGPASAVPRYGFSRGRDVAGFLYALADGRLRLEIPAEPGRFEVIELAR